MEGELNIDLFISLIKSKENIWNYKSTGYNDRQQRYNAWLSVCKEIVPNYEEKTKADQSDIVVELQGKWKVLRDGFSRSYKNLMKKSGSAKNAIKKYAYYDELLFLKELHDFKHQNEESGAGTRTTPCPDEDAAGEKISRKRSRRIAKEPSWEDDSIDTRGDEPTPMEGKNRKKQTRIIAKAPTSEEILIQKLTQRANERLNTRTPEIEWDDDKLFLMSLQKDFNSIPEAHKLDAKFDIINVLRRYRNISTSSHFDTKGPSSHAVGSRNTRTTDDTEPPVSTTGAVVTERTQSQNSTYYVKREDNESDEED